MQSMSIESLANWRLPAAAAVFALGAAILSGPAKAGQDTASLSQACFGNDSIEMGKRLQPRPDVIEERLNSPECRNQAGPADPSVDDSAAVQRELDRIDRKLTKLYRQQMNPGAPTPAN
jgi:hypothetical protein